MPIILATLKAEAGGLPRLRSTWAGDQIQGCSGHLSETLSQDKTNHCCLVSITLVSKYFIQADIMNGGKSVCRNCHPGSHYLPCALFSLGFIQSLDLPVLTGMVNLKSWLPGSNRMEHSQSQQARKHKQIPLCVQYPGVAMTPWVEFHNYGKES